MRFKLYFTLENESFPIQYRKSILSFIKASLSQYSEEDYKKFYNEKDCIIKPYTFAVFFANPVFGQEEIIIKDKKIELNLSVADDEMAVTLYNAFNHQKYKKFSLHQNSIMLQNISLVKEKQILQNILNIKFLSPLVVRSRNQETRKDYYYSYSSEQFINALKINLKEQLKITDISINMIDTFEIKPIQAKKTVVKFYEKQIECSLGTFQISGEEELLKYFYQAGMGSKRSSGFGMFQII